jgi:aldose sugar dehydrogenase
VAPDARGKGGQAGGQIAFSPDGQYLFMTVGDRQRMTPAQDPNQPVGKILRLTLDGKPAPGNPNFGKTGAATIPLIDPPRNTEAAKTAKPVSMYTFPGPNLTPAETWASGVRAPYGLAFSPTGELWEVEHGPRGGDELNLIEKGKNYGWPVVSYGVNYDRGAHPQSRHPARVRQARALLDARNRARQPDVLPRQADLPAVGRQRVRERPREPCAGPHRVRQAVERWDIGKRIRDVAQAPDGSLWMLEDANPGALIHGKGGACKAVPSVGMQSANEIRDVAQAPDGSLCGCSKTPTPARVAATNPVQ